MAEFDNNVRAQETIDKGRDLASLLNVLSMDSAQLNFGFLSIVYVSATVLCIAAYVAEIHFQVEAIRGYAYIICMAFDFHLPLLCPPTCLTYPHIPIAHCPLPIAHCPLPIAHCPLPLRSYWIILLPFIPCALWALIMRSIGIAKQLCDPKHPNWSHNQKKKEK